MVPDGAVLIHNGLIQAVGSNRQILNLARARNCDEIDATGRVVMPAFVDPLASLVQTRPSPRNYERLFRNYDNADAEAFREALQEGVRALNGISPKALRRRCAQAAAGMLRHGTGTVESRAPYCEGETTAMKILRLQTEESEQGNGLQICSSWLLQSPGAANAANWTDYVCRGLMPKVRRRKMASSVDLEYDSRDLHEEQADYILRAAAHFGFKPKVHTGFFSESSAVPLAIRTRTNSVEVDRRVREPEIAMLAESSTIAVFTPGVDLQTGLSRHAPGRAMVDSGVIPALASRYHPELSPAYSMQMILLLASRLYRFTPAEAITAATINSAHAIGVEDTVGSIETGKQADVLILQVSDYRELAYHAGINVVEKVIKRGMVVYDSHVDAATHSGDADLQLGTY